MEMGFANVLMMREDSRAFGKIRGVTLGVSCDGELVGAERVISGEGAETHTAP